MTINILIWSQITGYITGVIKELVNKTNKTIEQVTESHQFHNR